MASSSPSPCGKSAPPSTKSFLENVVSALPNRRGLTELPAYVREADDQSLLEMALGRKHPASGPESARSGHVVSSFDGRVRLDSRVAWPNAWAWAVRRWPTTCACLDCPSTLQAMLRLGTLSLGHAKTLAGVKGPDARYTQIAFAEKVVAEGISVRELERWVKQGGWKAPPKSPSPPLASRCPPTKNKHWTSFAPSSAAPRPNGAEAQQARRRTTDTVLQHGGGTRGCVDQTGA